MSKSRRRTQGVLASSKQLRASSATSSRRPSGTPVQSCRCLSQLPPSFRNPVAKSVLRAGVPTRIRPSSTDIAAVPGVRPGTSACGAGSSSRPNNSLPGAAPGRTIGSPARAGQDCGALQGPCRGNCADRRRDPHAHLVISEHGIVVVPPGVEFQIISEQNSRIAPAASCRNNVVRPVPLPSGNAFTSTSYAVREHLLGKEECGTAM